MKNQVLKKVLSSILILNLAFGLMACGKDEQTENTASSEKKSSVVESSESESSVAEKPEREHVELSWYIPRNEQPGTQAMISAANEYLKEKLNTTVDIHFAGAADYNTTVTTMLDSGADMDMLLTGSTFANFNTYAARNAFAPIGEFVDEYLTETKAQLSQGSWDAFTQNGELYAVPIVKDLFRNFGMSANQTMLDDLGVKFPEKYATAWDLVPFYYEVKSARDAKYPDRANDPIIQYPVMYFDGWQVYEPLVGGIDTCLVAANVSNYIDYGFVGMGEGEKVFCPVYTDEYRAVMKQIQQMVADGILPFDAENFDPDKILFNEGALLGAVGMGNIYVDEDANAPYYKTTLYKSEVSIATTDILQVGGIAISAQSEHVERCLEVIELLQNDTYLATVLHFGPEGEGWTDNDNDGVIELTEKNSDSSNRYCYAWYGWQLGGVTAMKPIPGLPANFGSLMRELNTTAEVSDNLGFIFNQATVESELAACNNVYLEYHKMLKTGQNENVDQLVDEFIEKLKANGMDKIVKECQDQLDAWRAANGK